MKPLYGFGHTQEDERTEAAALGLPGGDVLSITSAGEMPLNLLAMGADRVVAVDIAPEQNHLARLKLAAAIHLPREEAIRFIGYMPAADSDRRAWLAALIPRLDGAAAEFWTANADRIDDGPIWLGRFEHYIHLALKLAGPVLSKPFRRLAACETMEEQRQVFGETLDTAAIHGIFRLVFSPTLYGGRGLDEQALQHHDPDAKPLGERFFDSLRALCENTPARSNPYLQLFSLGEVHNIDVVPTYLTAEGCDVLKARHDQLEIIDGDVNEYLRQSPPGAFDRFHLSNVTDWMPYENFDALLRLIVEKAQRPAKVIWRAIHAGVPIPEDLRDTIVVDEALGAQLRKTDRFPMYTVLPGTIS